ncbi:MAG TPA: hypothetical protein VN618_13115 [Solirubrobacteraceae bacterium]|nr:hypothetical protein [Solirubrobacteraceae bacterium]
MLGANRRRILPLAAVLTGALASAGAVLALGDPDGRGTASAARVTGACGVSGPATVAAVQDLVARRIYADELHGRETLEDAARVRSFQPLLGALERGEPAAVASAVHALVYMPHWHIVRLRVMRGSKLLADVGGPHVTAPVTGVLRAHGRPLARYVMSVQDDLGYQKLVTRFIGAPIDIYQHGAFVMGTLTPAPAMPADGSRVQVAGRSWLVQNVAIRAFPSGSLQASLFIPASTGAASSCATLRLEAWGAVARHLAARLSPLSSARYQALADLVRSITGGRLLVRSGSQRLVGGGPARLPSTGTVSYAGRRWPVYSWQPVAGQRVYLLAPPG